MAIRKVAFVNGEHYHVFNRGVDKRDIFLDKEDLDRFFQSMDEFNVADPIGSIYENSFRQTSVKNDDANKLVNFICYCLNPNHYHFVLEQIADNGIEKLMHKIGGYPKFFNHKYSRSGALFQGKFKAVLISTNEQLLHTSAYVNLNNRVHLPLRSKAPKLNKTSWSEYTENSGTEFCKKDIVLEQFKNNKAYEDFAKESLKDIQKRKEEMKGLLIEE